MPGATLPNTGILLPVLGGDAGEWDDLINDAWGNYDVHDHSPGKGVAIPTDGIALDADLSFNGYAAIDVAKVALVEIATPSSGASYFWTSTADHELYWRTSAGSNLKITSGGGLNVSIVGGIAGDYAAVGAELAYDDANDTYTFKQQGSPRPWARIDSADVRLHQYNINEALYVGLKAPDALAASFTVTLPLALPGAKSLVHMAADGTLTASNAVDEDVVFSSANVDFSAGLKIRNAEVLELLNGAHLKLDAGHLIDGSALFNTNNTVTLVGVDGDVLHDEYTMAWTPDNSWMFDANGAGGAGALSTYADAAGGWGSLLSYAIPNNGNVIRVPLQGLRPGDRIKRVTVTWTGSVANNPPAILIKSTSAYGITSGQTTTSRGASYYVLAFGVENQEFTVDVPAPIAKTQLHAPTVTDWYIAKNDHLVLKSTVNTTAVYKVSVVYDRQATPTVG